MSGGQANQQAPKAADKLALEVRRGQVLEKAWLAIQRNARSSKSLETKNEIAAFAVNARTNLTRISRQLQKRTFVFPAAHGAKIPKDKNNPNDFRPLVIATVEARIVQRAIHDVLVTVPAIQHYVRTPHSFGGIKKAKDDQLSAVPAAIQSLLEAIGNGAKYIIRSDISSFFTRISKSAVIEIVETSAPCPEFVDLFKRAITVELKNMAQLRSHAKAFPIEDIGVAQGNSLSPLLGNIILYSFDKELNVKPDVRCIRYIDDFIILAPNKSVAENTFAKARAILKGLGMEVSLAKTQRAGIDEVFEFLGIELSSGLIRPSKKSREKMVASVKNVFSESVKAFRASHSTGEFDPSMSLLKTMSKVNGIMQGWGKHYRFCNDGNCLQQIDGKIAALFKEYWAIYREEREKQTEVGRWKLLGMEAVSHISRTPFLWPKKDKTAEMQQNEVALISLSQPDSGLDASS